MKEEVLQLQFQEMYSSVRDSDMNKSNHDYCVSVVNQYNNNTIEYNRLEYNRILNDSALYRSILCS